MNNINFSELSIKKIDKQEAKDINGGGIILVHPYFVKKAAEFVDGVIEGYNDAIDD